jgi:2,3-bisphosphoglycerate-dependent phosphoglycerate mutase
MTTIYFIRHAQSHQSATVAFSDWPLSAAGQKQAERLADLLSPLGLVRLYSSPYERCLRTIGPFAAKTGMALTFHDDLRESLLAPTLGKDLEHAWRRSWADFGFALPGCESNGAAQRRFVSAVREIAGRHRGETIGICAHGNVIGLFLHHLDNRHGRETAEAIRNPDVLKIGYSEGSFAWHGDYRLHGLDAIASHHIETPVDHG